MADRKYVVCMLLTCLFRSVGYAGGEENHISDMSEKMSFTIPKFVLRNADLTNVVFASILMSRCLCETNEVQFAQGVHDELMVGYHICGDAISPLTTAANSWWNFRVSGEYQNKTAADILISILNDEKRIVATNDLLIIKSPMRTPDDVLKRVERDSAQSPLPWAQGGGDGEFVGADLIDKPKEVK